MVGSAPRKENLQRSDRIVPARKTPIIQVTSPKGITKAPPFSNKNSSVSIMEKINEAFVRLESRMDHADHTYNHLYAFRFQLGLRNYRTPTDHMRSAQLMRHIAARYSQFNVTTFHEYYPFADQYIELKPALIRNCILALISMLVVSFVMIPNYDAAFAIAGAICSIDLGLIGYMTFWGVRLESVSMITVIMSIGFEVDLSAHIGYAYVKAHGDRNKKAIQALETIGWPVFLGAFSTVLGILVLNTVHACIVQIFFKTIFLAIVFSMTHGLIFLLVLLTVILPHAKDRDVG